VGSAPQYYHHDGLRNTAALTTLPAGATTPEVTASYRTDLFGQTRARPTLGSTNRHIFSGHENDAETGLVYMMSRCYDPALGRFLTLRAARPRRGGPRCPRSPRRPRGWCGPRSRPAPASSGPGASAPAREAPKKSKSKKERVLHTRVPAVPQEESRGRRRPVFRVSRSDT